jgi:hypothetical protein
VKKISFSCSRGELKWVEKNAVLVVGVKRSLSPKMVKKSVKYVNTHGNIEQKGRPQRRVESDFDKIMV